MLGLPNNRIFGFLYSGWSERFPAGPPLGERPLRMLFVGQYIHRKGLDLLIEAWRRFSATHPQWELALYGAGELQAQLERELPQAIVHPFQQTDEIAAAMRSARFFVLPAREDHWPLVVHESATSGCALVLSTNIGNLGELTSPRNAITFPSGSADGLHAALCQAAGKDAAWLEQAGPESRRRAAEFGPDKFAATFREICATLLSQPPKTR
jgi:glycosyltransferase involved in cell wall biosynthesis